MRLSRPTNAVFVVSLILAGLALASQFTPIPYVSGNQFWVAIAAYVVLMLGNLLKGL